MAAVEGCGKLFKYLLFLFNLLVWLASIGLIIMGVMIKTGKADEVLKLSGSMSGYGVTIIIAGVVIFVTTFFGCYGAIRENSCFLFIYSIIMFLIFLIGVIVVIVAVVFITNEDKIKEAMRTSLGKYPDDKDFWDTWQGKEKCCGIDSYKDWFQVMNTTVPDSCCKTLKQDCGKNITDPTNINTSGCWKLIFDNIKEQKMPILIGMIVLFFVPLICLIIACCLATTIRKNYEHV